ncbi:MAG: HIT domain-containing protein [Planctomycetes bacterium]|nr:HIT domain-containing protein [Planctomycetota bacterium]
MERNLWAPWRMAYIRGLEAEAAEARTAAVEGGNFLLSAWRHPELDPANLVVHRNADGLLMLNRYPYANGHLLVALGDARPRLLDYAPAARAAFWRLVDTATLLVERCMHPQGVNIGLNQGRAGGAGLPEHVHAHVLPRWNGDTNFMATVAGARVIPEALESVATAYRAALPGVLAEIAPATGHG